MLTIREAVLIDSIVLCVLADLFYIENLVLRARSEFNGFAVTGASSLGVLEHINCGFRNADCGFQNKSSI
jgi:hypothetical protein